MNELRVVRGPLPPELRRQVIAGWGRYDPRLLDEEEWANEFERAPEGPALHVLVVGSDERVVGHHSAIPVRMWHGSRGLLVAKGEAIYVDRAHVGRGARVLMGDRPRRLVHALGEALFAHIGELGAVAYIGYAQPQSESRLVEAGCQVVRLPYRRFFAVHDAQAFVRRSSIGTKAVRSYAVAALRGYGLLARLSRRGRVRELKAAEAKGFSPDHDETFRAALDPERLAVDPAADQLNWRFPASLYRLFHFGDPPWGYAVLTGVERSGRQRVVDWLVPEGRTGAAPAVARTLVEASAASGAAALEWNLPVSSPPGARLARGLRRSGLLRDPRSWHYRMVVYGEGPFLAADRWHLTLSTHERF